VGQWISSVELASQRAWEQEDEEWMEGGELLNIGMQNGTRLGIPFWGFGNGVFVVIRMVFGKVAVWEFAMGGSGGMFTGEN
jgi:hypothetical protein